MSQRVSGYARKERDLYETPEWVTNVLVPHLPYMRRTNNIWEPAAGSGKMANALREHGIEVSETDIETGDDFLLATHLRNEHVTAIITNPPYDLATEFIAHALFLTQRVS